MCRHAAYIGPTSAVGPMMTDLEHSLLVQSYRPRELLGDLTVNADGFGLAWYDSDVQPEPAQYANPFPIWNDPGLPSMGQLIRSHTFLGAVRNATEAGSNAAVNCAPFVDGVWSWSLNGYLRGFAEQWRTMMLADWISPERAARIRGTTDAEHLFQAFLTRVEDGQDPSQALKSLCRDVASFAEQNGWKTQLNLLVSDGDQVWATRDGNQESCNSLYHLFDGEEFPGAHLIASEPLMDDPEWAPVDAGTLLVVSADAPPVRLAIHA